MILQAAGGGSRLKLNLSTGEMNFTGIFSQGGEIGYERNERIKEEENERVAVIFTELLHETRPPRPFRFIIMFQLSLKGRNESNVARK